MALIKTYSDVNFNQLEQALTAQLQRTAIPTGELLKNLGLYLSPGALGRILYIYELYRQIVPIQGCIAEFGCRYGQNLALFNALRGLLEPFNRLRKVIGFDTFRGFPSVHQNDGANNSIGDYSVPDDYESYLDKNLQIIEGMSPLSHLKKYELVSGDASVTVERYIEDNPHTIFALCYFDMDIYKPTRDVLSQVLPKMGRGAILAFDELNDEDMPGETIAVLESFDIRKVTIRRNPLSARTSYIILE